jgi:hypothetical protein
MPELGALQPQPTPPIKARIDPFTGSDRLTPTVTELDNGNIVFDMGLNFAGVVELKLTVSSLEVDSSSGAAHTSAKNSAIVYLNQSEAGDLHARHEGFEWELQNGLRYNSSQETIMELKYGEVLWPNGTVNPLTSTAGQIKRAGCCGSCAPPVAYQRDTLIVPTSDDSATYEFSPDFTWHGYRFVEISLSPRGGGRKVEIELIGIPISTAVPVTGEFSSSNALLGDIHAMATNTHLSNMQGQQSDCPHRERFGYDIHTVFLLLL